MYQRYALSLDPTREQGAFWRVLADMVPRAKRLIAEGGVPTVVGGSTLEYDAFNQEREYNSAFLVNGDGTSGGRYDKMHRVPWGEYIPGPAWLKDAVLRYLSPYGPENDYTIDAGERVVVMEVDWPVVRLEYVQVSPPPAFPNSLSATHHDVLRFATPICFEDTVGRLCRRMVFDPQTGEKRIDALVNLTTNGWFGYLPESGDPSSGGLAWESMRLQHLQIATLRAIENRVTVARAVNTGCSAIIAPSGMILAMGAPGWAEVVTGPIVRDERVPLYAIVGEWPMVGVFSLGVVMLVCPWLLPFGQKRVRLPGGKPSSGVDVSKPASAD
jgi:apolipoprotein N-acyltransferase